MRSRIAEGGQLEESARPIRDLEDNSTTVGTRARPKGSPGHGSAGKDSPPSVFSRRSHLSPRFLELPTRKWKELLRVRRSGMASLPLPPADQTVQERQVGRSGMIGIDGGNVRRFGRLSWSGNVGSLRNCA